MFSASHVTKICDWPPETLRALRRRRILIGYGKVGTNDRWDYSLTDLVAFFLAKKILSFVDGLDQKTAFQIARDDAPTVMAMSRENSKKGVTRWTCVVRAGSGQSQRLLDRLGDLETKHRVETAFLVDRWGLALSLKDENKELYELIAGAEDG